MPWNGAGLFTRTNGTYNGSTVWGQDAAAGTLITSTNHDTHDQDIAGGLNNCVTADGQKAATILNLVATVNSTTGVINIGSAVFAAMPLNAVFIGTNGAFVAGGATCMGIGKDALLNGSDIECTAVGNSAGLTYCGQGTVLLGNSAGFNGTGVHTTLIGSRAGSASAIGANVTGLGWGVNPGTGNYNICIGNATASASLSASGQINFGCAIFGTGYSGVSGSTPGAGKIGINNNAPTYTFDVKGGDIGVNTIGNGFRIAEGANAKMGVATLVGGTVTVSNTSVTANSRIFLTCETPGGTPGFLRVSARTAGTSFTILSSSGTDTSVVGWVIFEPY